MKHQKFLLVGMMLAVLALLVIPAFANDGTVTVSAYTETRVCSGPGTTYSIVGLVYSGESLTATGRDGTGNSWLRVNYEGTEGWVAASVVVVNGDPTTLEIVSPAAAQTVVGNTGVTVTAYDVVNARVGPGTSYRRVEQIEAGEVYDVTGRTSIPYPFVCRGSSIVNALDAEEAADAVWLRINYGGAAAWVAYPAVSVSGNLCDVEQVSAADAVTTTVDVTGLPSGVIVVTQVNANLRASNYPSSEILGIVPYGTALVAEYRDSSSNRIQVTYEDLTGWIAVSTFEVVAGNLDSVTVGEE